LKACPDRRPSKRYLTSEILIAATSAMVAVAIDRGEAEHAWQEGTFA
jgi:hypothetical protein